MRELLIDACTFSWDVISPAIFGSLFQSVMDKKQRRALGAHYTTEKNILKANLPSGINSLVAGERLPRGAAIKKDQIFCDSSS
jgi:type II restriction/modification system DNA methylase subunit YeeA